MLKEEDKLWLVYLLECLDGSYYTGITNDIENRMKIHQSGKGSKYVLSHGFGKLLASKEYNTRSEALKVEYQVKQLSRDQKLFFLSN
ncbi:MAG: GIY-YIG nuclease family protein [archaeon]|nr:GIY-YIG nuclease family protein [archaeon]